MPDISLAIAWNVFSVLLVIGLSARVIMYMKGLKEEVSKWVILSHLELDRGRIGRMKRMASFKLVDIARICKDPTPSLVLPCVITELASNWPAAKKWKIGQLEMHYGDRIFECGRDFQDNTPILMKLSDYLKSDRNNYLFDSSFDFDASEMNNDYTVPSLFADLLDHLPRELIDGIDRRWLIIGRGKFLGGSNFHQDPMGDSWNTLLEGRKKWIIIEPNAHDYSIGHPNISPTINFCNFGVNELYYEHAKGKISQTANATRNVYVFYQYPGDTVYIPHKYHHMVLNLSTSVAITHNYVPLRPERVLSFLRDVKLSLNDPKYQRLERYIIDNMNKLIRM